MNAFNVFTSDAFGYLALTDSVNRMPYVPGRVGRLGIFDPQPIATKTVAIEERLGLLSLVPNTPRGAAPVENAHNKAKLRYFAVPHFPISDSILPDEVQDIRLFGNVDGGLATVQAVVDDRLANMTPKLDATVEYGRLGAIKGLILDADGSTVIYNLFTEFGVSQQTLDLFLGTTTTNQQGNLTAVAGLIEDELGSATYDHIHILMGKTMFANFVGHASVQNAFHLWQRDGQLGALLRDDLRYSGFPFGPAIIEQYRGNVGGVAFIADNEGYAFPVGVPGLFKTYFAPADWMTAVNTLGLPRYAKQWVDPNGEKFVRLETQTNPLSLCLRPRATVKLSTSN